MDPNMEAEVWNRVNAAARSAEDGTARERGPIGPELLEAMTRARETCRELRVLSQRTNGEMSRALRQLAAGIGNQEKNLGALYFFLTGSVACPGQASNLSHQEKTVDTVRRLMQGRELNAGRFEALAVRTAGESQRILLELAQEEQQNFRILLRLLKSCL